MNMRIVTMVAVMAGLSLAACDKKDPPPPVVDATPAATAGPSHTDGAPEQQK